MEVSDTYDPKTAPCPKCGCPEKQVLSTAYVYLPYPQHMELMSTSYTYICALCGATRVVTVTADDD